MGSIAGMALLTACEPTLDPEILGASVMEEEVVLDVLDAFRSAVVPERLPGVRSITFTELEDAAGRQRGPHIDIQTGLDTYTLTLTLWHELCHIADIQSPHPSRNRDWPVFDGIAPVTGTDEEARSEVFAALCEYGPTGLGILRGAASSCLPDEVDEAAAEVMTEYFREDARPRLDITAVPARSAMWPFQDQEAPHVGSAWLDDNRLLADPRGEQDAALDLDTGEWKLLADRANRLPDQSALVSGSEDHPVRGGWLIDEYEVGGFGTVRVVWSKLAWGGDVSVIESGGDAPVLAGGCVPGRAALRARSRAIAWVSLGAETRWLEVSDLLDRTVGEDWRAEPGVR